MPHDSRDTIDHFLAVIGEMLGRADFLLPLAAAQRQFRADNYQMASASQLEDLFHDAVSTYVREAHPRVRFRRRTGSELWDYEFEDLGLSHKESQSLGFAVWWTGGDQVDGAWVPKRPSWEYEHPIVFSYTRPLATSVWSVVGEDLGRVDGYGSLGARAVAKKSLPRASAALVSMTWESERTFLTERTWPPGTWESLGFHDLWPDLGGHHLDRRDLWLVRPDCAPSASTGLELHGEHLPTGLYVFEQEDLQAIPLVANNRAHSASPAFVENLMRQCLSNGRYTPLPLWFAHFAASTPPNLYARQRVQFANLFAPRESSGP